MLTACCNPAADPGAAAAVSSTCSCETLCGRFVRGGEQGLVPSPIKFAAERYGPRAR